MREHARMQRIAQMPAFAPAPAAPDPSPFDMGFEAPRPAEAPPPSSRNAQVELLAWLYRGARLLLSVRALLHTRP